MPCYCWYDPPEESKKLIKDCCQKIVDEVKKLEKDGDPAGWGIRSIHTLLDHLYRPQSCKENNNNK